METEVNQTGTSVQEVADKLTDKWTEPEVTEDVKEASQDVELQEVESVDSEQTEEPESVEEETSFSTIYELAEALESDPEEFLANIKANVKVGGKESEVTLAEALKGYQLDADYRRKTMEVAEERKTVEQAKEAIAAQEQAYSQKIQEADATANLAMQSLIAEYNQVDWARLKAEDQTEFLIRQQDYQGRMQQIQQAKHAIMEQSQQAQQAHIQELLPKEHAALKRAIPEWDDTDVMTAEQKQIAEYLSEGGFAQDEINNLYDHRAVVIARKAMLYDKAKSMHKSPSESDKKVVRKVTKILKPGARKQATTVKDEAVKKARSRLKKTGKPADAAAALLSRWQ